VALVGPIGVEANHDAAVANEELGLDFDQSRAPCFDLTFAMWVAVAMTLEEAAAVGSSVGFGGEVFAQVARFGQFVRCELPGHRAAQSDQEVQRGCVQIESKEVGHKAVIAQAVRTQTALEFLVSVLVLAAFCVEAVSNPHSAGAADGKPSGESQLAGYARQVLKPVLLVVDGLRQHLGTGTLGNHGAAICALRVGLALDDHPLRMGPRSGLFAACDCFVLQSL